jgi:hypothetical protein
MKAIVHDKYGSFDVLGVRDIDKPVVKDDEVLATWSLVYRIAKHAVGVCIVREGRKSAGSVSNLYSVYPAALDKNRLSRDTDLR